MISRNVQLNEIQQKVIAHQGHILPRIQLHTATRGSPEPEVTSKEN